LSVRTRKLRGAHAVEYMLAGEEVSHLCVRDFRMRVGSAILRMGGIADVETKEAYRGRGYARQVLDRALPLMRKEGYDISTLFGVSDFYPRWGYAPIFPETGLTLATEDAARAQQVYRLRPLGRDEVGATLDLYRRNNARRTGAIVRGRDRWAGFRLGSRWGRPVSAYGAFDPAGRLMGYVVLDRSPTEAIMVEIGYRREEVFGTLLAAGMRQARRAKAQQIHALVPPDHPFLEYCQRLGCRLTLQYHRSGGAMGRIINLATCFARLTPELTRRLGSGPLPWTGRLRIETDIGEVILRLEQGAVTCDDPGGAADASFHLGQALLTQLIFGYTRPAEALRAGDGSLRGAPVQLIEALFPRGHAYVWRPDHF